MTEPNNELDDILSENFYWKMEGREKVVHLNQKQAVAAINSLTLKQVLALIGDNIPTDLRGSWTRRKDGTMILLSDEIIVTNNLKDQLRQSAERIWKP